MNKLIEALRNRDVRMRLIFTVLMLMVFRIGSNIPVPGINHNVLEQTFNGDMGLFDLFDLFSGGSFSNFTVFALGVTPYITATIVVQLLTYAFPTLENLQDAGMAGQKKLIEINRRLAIILALIQGAGLTFGLFRKSVINTSPFVSVMIVGILVAGSAFLMWVGEQIEEYGIGNGMSILIFGGIAARIPSDIRSLAHTYKEGQLQVISLGLLIIAAIIVIGVVVLFQKGKREIPVHYATRVVGRKTYKGENTYIPIKVNAAGVMPIIFAISLLQFPITIAYFFPKSKYYSFCSHYLSTTGSPGIWIYSALNIILTFLFTFMYVAIIFKPEKIAKNMAQAGGFIPGIRPGKDTENYLNTVSRRLCVVAGIFLAAVETLPVIVSQATPIDFRFGGTSLLILVGVALDMVDQMENRALLYKQSGFLL